MENFFTEAFGKLENQEDFYKTVFMNMSSPEAGKLRVAYYASKMKHMGSNVTIGAGVKIVNPEFISLGDNVRICDGVTLIARGAGGIEIDDGARLQDRVYIDTESPDHGYVRIGKRVYIGTGTTLFGHLGLEIGDDSLLAQNITITPYSHIFEDPDEVIIRQGGNMRKVVLGRDCYIGMNVCILYSADIGDKAVVGSGSAVWRSRRKSGTCYKVQGREEIRK